MYQATQRPSDRAIYRSTERPSDLPTLNDRTIERPIRTRASRPFVWATSGWPSTKCSIDQSTDRPSDRASDRAVDVANDRTTQRCYFSADCSCYFSARLFLLLLGSLLLLLFGSLLLLLLSRFPSSSPFPPLPPPPTRSCPPSDRPVERTSERAIEQTISCRTVPIDGLVRYREANRIYMDAHTHTYIQTSLHTPVQRAVGPDPPAIPKNKRMACFPRAGARVSQRQCR